MFILSLNTLLLNYAIACRIGLQPQLLSLKKTTLNIFPEKCCNLLALLISMLLFEKSILNEATLFRPTVCNPSITHLNHC